MNDERAGLPSASAVPRYAACNGSFLLSRGIPDIQTAEMKAWGESGDRIHLFLSDPEFITLDDPHEIEVAGLCAEQRDAVVRKVFGDNSTPQILKEERLWLLEGRKRVFSGKSDDTRVFGNIGLIIDFKTNRGDIEESPKNMQLRSLAVTLKRSKHGKNLTRIFVAIVQPLVNREPLICCYEQADLELAEKELAELLVKIYDPNATRNPNEYCKFCPAKFKCPELKAAMEKLGEGLPPEADGTLLGELLDLCLVAKPVIKAIESRAKELLKQNPEAVPGWLLGKPGTVRSVTDPFAVFKALSDANLLTRDQFLNDCISVGIGDLEKAIAKHNAPKGAVAKETVNSVCGPFIELKPKEPSLEKL